ncbi:deaminase domain-containing protein [Paenibacillus kandeliae]|uniref:deaminase domain-containing protein n=1 Tax=Paenibacillus kandeliae TaxID=3231269 RepID=UPI00345A1423
MVEYRYTEAGELSEVKDWNGRLTAYRYDRSGRLIQTRRPNGSREERSYDAAGQLTRLTDTSGLGIRLQQFRYTYSPAGQLLQEEDRQYTYDNFKRLIHGQLPDQTIRYTYDRAGNLTEEQRELAGIASSSGSSSSSSRASTQQWFYQADNRLLRVGEYPVELDADGNLLYATDGEQMGAYEYDARNRLIQSGRLRYRYSASGNRIEMRQRKSVIRYVVDESSPLSRMLMEVNEEGKALAWYVYGLGLIGREDADGQYLSYHSDLRGSTTILTNEASQVTDRYTYGLYGELESHEGSTNQPFRYNGRDGAQTDPNGLYYMRARYYDPKLKRFLNRDVIQGTITDGQTFNRYAYVNGNPVSYVDPLGLEKAKLGNCSANNPYPTRAIDPATEGHMIDRVRELRSSLTSGLKRGGNFALAEVNIIGNSQKEYFAHSGIDKLTGTLAERVPTISLQPKNPVFESTLAVGKEGEPYSRASDTEYKIINHLANQLGEQTTVSGNIKLFTELDTCSSCNRVIAEFASKYKNIAVEVIHNNGERLIKKL